LFTFDSRPVWLVVGIAFAIGAFGQALVLLGLDRTGLAGPVVDLLLPGLLGLLTGFVSPRGIAVAGLGFGMILAFQLVPLLGGPTAGLVEVALALAAAGIGYAVAWGIQQSSAGFAPAAQLSSTELARREESFGGQLRMIDPTAPGAFEHASVLLRQVNEHLSMYGPWGPWQTSDKSRREAPTELLRIQAEVLEAARQSAIAAGATRVTVSATQGGIDIQAIWGEPPLIDTTAVSHEEPYG
jgi:hypothetical protein